METTDLDVIVVSAGGAGTTFVLDFLSQFVRTNQSTSMKDGIKHINSPRHQALATQRIARAIYLYEDPRIAVLSLFRRGYQRHMIPKLNANHSSPESYREFVNANLVDVELDRFVANGIDLFNVSNHMHNWLFSETVPFPVLCVKYRHLYDHLVELCAFAGLPASTVAAFPARKQRESSLADAPPSVRAGLDAMYADLVARCEALPSLFIRHANPGERS